MENVFFSVMGLEREKAIKALLNLVNTFTLRKYSLLHNINVANVFDILLADIAFKSNEQHIVTESKFNAIKTQVINHVKTYQKRGEYMPYNQDRNLFDDLRVDAEKTTHSIVDAIGLMNKVNIAMYIVSDNNQLTLVSRNINDSNFNTIPILHVCADGYSDLTGSLNHYVKLQPYEPRVVVVDNPGNHGRVRRPSLGQPHPKSKPPPQDFRRKDRNNQPPASEQPDTFFYVPNAEEVETRGPCPIPMKSSAAQNIPMATK